MKKVIFIVLLLAVASLGLALPQKLPPSPKLHSISPTPSAKSLVPTGPTLPTDSPKPPTIPTEPPTSPAPPNALPAEFASPEALENGLDISKSCASALLTIATSPAFLKCIPVQAFLPLIPILSDPNFLQNLAKDPAGTFKKIEPTLVQFSDAFCPTQKCSDKDVAGAIKLISDGCKDDLKDNKLIQLIFDLAVFYSPLHDTVCFKSKDKKLGKTYCWDESISTVFSLPKSPIKITGNPLLDSVAVSDPFAICTTCNKDIVNTFFNFIKNNDLALQILTQMGVTDKVIAAMQVGVAVKCGIEFEDGKIP